MKILSLTLLLLIVACGKSSSNKSSKNQDPVRGCNDGLSLCAERIEWSIETQMMIPENFLIAVATPTQTGERMITLVDTCRGSDVQVVHGRRGDSKILFENPIRLNPSEMNRLKLVDLGPSCQDNNVLFYNYIPSLVVAYDSQQGFVVRQTIRLEN